MNSLMLGIISFICVLGGALIGMLLRYKLPNHHLTGDSKDAIKIASGMIATFSALVLGLLVSSAKSSFDEMNNAITQSSAKIIMLDRALAQYGPEGQVVRDELLQFVSSRIRLIWPDYKKGIDGKSAFEKSDVAIEVIANKIRELKPANDSQRAFQSDALQLCRELLQTRWIVIEKAQLSLPTAFIVALLFWLSIFFCSIGLFAPFNKTVLIAFIVCSLSVAGAVFLIEEMNEPTSGIVKVSNAPLIKALEHMGKSEKMIIPGQPPDNNN